MKQSIALWEHPLWEVGQQQPKLYNNRQYLESSNCKQDWRAYWNLTSATKFNVGQYNESLRISFCVVIISPNNETTTDVSEEFQNQLMPKWAHSRNKEEVFQFAVTRITSS
ncbi:hypothetical protein K7M74_002055 [Salmonella enterica]|uniref:hypothetical protein n=1 Tax=Salmonella enterica TaxID=28901 RepID=UPI0009B123CF|nr:hypothetical protein [Salmonella enterica]EAV6171012.1 hypothetical protein [Salmonella enterica subsp. enterica serovar Havana]EGF9043537.1 hypothetical protein [Salmonella enterica]EHM7937692.1 hypothetical protein [Salmonella enterica subsp. enterica serovar Havana]EIA5033913.1 hypothetical protein [Salmonella enterica]EIP8337600.1 hypothetical protein [Salmonella enterica]